MKCPECGSKITLEIGPDWPLSTSLADAILTADENELIEISRICWDCGWHEEREITVGAIETVSGDEQTVERVAIVNDILYEIESIDNIATLENALSEVRKIRDGRDKAPNSPTDTSGDK